MFTHGARFASVSLSGASPDVKANSINLVDKVVQRSISAQGTLSEGVDLYIPIFLAETEPQQAVRSAGDGLPVLMMADRERKWNQRNTRNLKHKYCLMRWDKPGFWLRQAALRT